MFDNTAKIANIRVLIYSVSVPRMNFSLLSYISAILNHNPIASSDIEIGA